MDEHGQLTRMVVGTVPLLLQSGIELKGNNIHQAVKQTYNTQKSVHKKVSILNYHNSF